MAKTSRRARLAWPCGRRDARRALLMALRLRGAEDDDALLAETPETTPVDAVAPTLRDFPAALFAPLLEAIARRVASGPHAQLMLTGRASCVSRMRARCTRPRTGGSRWAAPWSAARRRGRRGRERGGGVLPALRRVSKAFAGLHDDLAATAETSVFLLDYVCAAPPVAEVTRGDAVARRFSRVIDNLRREVPSRPFPVVRGSRNNDRLHPTALARLFEEHRRCRASRARTPISGSASASGPWTRVARRADSPRQPSRFVAETRAPRASRRRGVSSTATTRCTSLPARSGAPPLSDKPRACSPR